METKFVTKMDHKAASLQKQIADLGLKLHDSINRSKEDLQSIRGYTVVLKSEGIVKKYQPDVLGVYRMVDSYDNRPVYKQDGGENYIYYSAASRAWFVGTVVGHRYGWLKNASPEASAARWVPDLRAGWQYRPLVRTTADSIGQNTWLNDDQTIRMEPLKGPQIKLYEIICFQLVFF